MRIPLDRDAETPLFAQVAAFLRERCRSGALAPGSRLPSARALAEELGVSRVTAEGAYAELEAEAFVERRRGSGTYVARRRGAGRARAAAGEGEAVEPVPAWQAELAGRGGLAEPGLGMGTAAAPGLVDLASGLSDPALFPAEDFRRALREVLAFQGDEAFGYGDPRGYLPFREAVARVLASRGVDARAEEILVTSGSQEALCLCALLARERGGPVLVETPTYAAALSLFRSLGLEVRGLDSDSGGPRLEALERALAGERPSLLYLMPNFRNPSGTSVEGPRRAALVALAERACLPILEDDYVGDLRFEGRDLPALAAYGGPGATLYAGTFSKMLAPGLRVGFLVARGPVYRRLLELKYSVSMAAPNLAQRALAEILSVGSYERHLGRSRRAYRARRDAMLRGLAALPPGYAAERPSGGLFAWLRLPPGASASALAAAAAARGLLVYDGGRSFPDRGHPLADSFLRLNFAASTEAAIGEGLARLAQAAASL